MRSVAPKASGPSRSTRKSASTVGRAVSTTAGSSPDTAVSMPSTPIRASACRVGRRRKPSSDAGSALTLGAAAERGAVPAFAGRGAALPPCPPAVGGKARMRTTWPAWLASSSRSQGCWPVMWLMADSTSWATGSGIWNMVVSRAELAAIIGTMKKTRPDACSVGRVCVWRDQGRNLRGGAAPDLPGAGRQRRGLGADQPISWAAGCRPAPSRKRRRRGG